MKVAICDDSEQDIADLKEKLLKIIEGQIENCEIHVYTDVTKFLKEIHTISFDGIFLDIDMPEMNGLEVASQRNTGSTAGQGGFAGCWTDFCVVL